MYKSNNDLPIAASPSAACAAARAGQVTMELPGIPVPIKVDFIGTGTAALSSNAEKVFQADDAADQTDMHWFSNRFVGRHWMLGDFAVELSAQEDSTGRVFIDGEASYGVPLVNENEFYFDFFFRRFPSLSMRNIDPIVNRAVVSGIPPIGSVYRLTDGREKANFIRGRDRHTENHKTSPTTIKFRQCEVTVYPDRNVQLDIVSQSKLNEDQYKVAVRITNPTQVLATFAYFNVIHFAAINVNHDYGFLKLSPGETATIEFEISSSVPDRTVTIPFFAGLYKPDRLRGACSVDLTYSF